MPIYEYQCAKCHHHLEALQKISDKPLRECPECGRHTLKRLVSAPMFRLAGSGWYETDFKSDKETRRNLAGREDAAPDSAGKDTDAKPAADAGKAATSDKAAKPDGEGAGGRKARATTGAAKTAPARATARPAAKPARKAPARKPAASKKKRGR